MRYGLRTPGFCAIGLASLIACGSSGTDSGEGTPRTDAALGETESGATGVTDDASSLDTDAGPGAPGDAETALGASDSGPRDAGHADAGAARCKRGIATNTPPSAALAPTASSPGVSWWYDWSLTGTGGSSAVEFVPMVWGSANAASALPAGARYVLGFNEPNFKGQANLSPQQAAAAWPTIEAHAKAMGAELVSPAVNYCGSASDSSQCTVSTITDPYTYLKDFFAACAGCQVDYVAVHWYNCDLPSLKAYLEGNLDAGGGLQGFVQFGKPIWLTEFSCDGSHSVADQTAYMKAAVAYLESNPHVFRYSWFSAGPIPNAELMNASGSLTALGSTYVALPQNCP